MKSFKTIKKKLLAGHTALTAVPATHTKITGYFFKCQRQHSSHSRHAKRLDLSLRQQKNIIDPMGQPILILVHLSIPKNAIFVVFTTLVILVDDN